LHRGRTRPECGTLGNSPRRNSLGRGTVHITPLPLKNFAPMAVDVVRCPSSCDVFPKFGGPDSKARRLPLLVGAAWPRGHWGRVGLPTAVPPAARCSVTFASAVSESCPRHKIAGGARKYGCCRLPPPAASIAPLVAKRCQMRPVAAPSRQNSRNIERVCLRARDKLVGARPRAAPRPALVVARTRPAHLPGKDTLRPSRSPLAGAE